jgi:hypothetical protein
MSLMPGEALLIACEEGDMEAVNVLLGVGAYRLYLEASERVSDESESEVEIVISREVPLCIVPVKMTIWKILITKLTTCSLLVKCWPCSLRGIDCTESAVTAVMAEALLVSQAPLDLLFEFR